MKQPEPGDKLWLSPEALEDLNQCMSPPYYEGYEEDREKILGDIMKKPDSSIEHDAMIELDLILAEINRKVEQEIWAAAVKQIRKTKSLSDDQEAIITKADLYPLSIFIDIFTKTEDVRMSFKFSTDSIDFSEQRNVGLLAEKEYSGYPPDVLTTKDTTDTGWSEIGNRAL